MSYSFSKWENVQTCLPFSKLVMRVKGNFFKKNWLKSNFNDVICIQKCIIGSCRKKSRHPITFDDLQLPKIDHKDQFKETQYIYQWILNVRFRVYFSSFLENMP